MNQNGLSISISIDGEKHNTFSGRLTIPVKKCFDIILKNHRNCYAAVFILVDKAAMCKPIILSPKEEKTIYGDLCDNSFVYDDNNMRNNVHVLEISCVFVSIDKIVKVVHVRDGNDRIPQIPQIPQAPKFPWQDAPIIWAIGCNYESGTGEQYQYNDNLPSNYIRDGDCAYVDVDVEYLHDSDFGFECIKDIVNTSIILLFVAKDNTENDNKTINNKKETISYIKCDNCGEYNSSTNRHCIFCGHRLT